MEGPLRSVVGLMMDPNSDKELRQAAEQVLVACGFSGGEKDFQMCFYDFQILHDWFTLRRSLKPQALGHRMVRNTTPSSSHLSLIFSAPSAHAPNKNYSAPPFYSPPFYFFPSLRSQPLFIFPSLFPPPLTPRIKIIMHLPSLFFFLSLTPPFTLR